MNATQTFLVSDWAFIHDGEAWAALGVTMAEARDWWNAVGEANDSRAYLNAGMTPLEVCKWRASREPAFATSTLVIAWHRTGLGLERARMWRGLRVTPQMATRYHQAGWIPAIVGGVASVDGQSPEIDRWLKTVCHDAGWQEWLHVKTAPEVVMLAHRCGLTSRDLIAILHLTKDDDLAALAIRAGYLVDELRDMDLGDSDVITVLAVGAALSTNAQDGPKVPFDLCGHW